MYTLVVVLFGDVMCPNVGDISLSQIQPWRNLILRPVIGHLTWRSAAPGVFPIYNKLYLRIKTSC